MNVNVTLNQFKHMVKTIGDRVTVIGQSEPGIGKSATLATLAKEMPTHTTCYIDCTLLDLGDFALPYTENEGGIRVTKFAPNARFGFQSDKPVIIMLDEIGKAMKSVKNVLLTLMLEQRIGDMYLPKGSIVFGTTNMVSDGVGDMLEAHAYNRVALVTIDKPSAGFRHDGTVDADSWGAWALNNDVHPAVLAWVKENPHCLASYTEGEAQKDNPYIFQPSRAGQTAFVSPRSLERASDIVKLRLELGDTVTRSALAGVVGVSAAADMLTFVQLVDKLPTWEEIVADPKGVEFEDKISVKLLLVLSTMNRVCAETIQAGIDFIKRMPLEAQAMFFRGLLGTDKVQILISNKDFMEWVNTHNELYV